MQGRRNLGATPAIRNLNRGHHNIRFDRPNRFGVACSALSHFGSSRFFFFNCREQGNGAPRCGVALAFLRRSHFSSRGVWSAQVSLQRQGIVGPVEPWRW